MAQMVTVRIFRFFSFLFLLLAALTASDRVFAQVAAPPSVQTNITVGNGPYAVGVNVLSNKIYVVNQNGNSVSVIAGASNSAPSAAIAVGTLPYAVAVNPLTNMIYVANEGSNNVSVINGATDTVVATIPVGNNPYAIVANAATNRIYSINNGSVPNGKSVQGTVTVIDGSSNTVVTTIPVGFSPVAAAVNGVTNKIYVADLGDTGAVGSNPGDVEVIDGSSNTVVGTVPASACATGIKPCQNPRAIAVNSVTNMAYAVYITTNAAVAIDGSQSTYPVVGTVKVGTDPREVQVNPETNKIYVANQGSSGTSSSTVSILNGANFTAAGTSTVGVGIYPRAVVVNPINNQIYVGNQNSNTVSVIDGASNSVSSWTVQSTPFAIGVNPITNWIYVANNGSKSVSVINGDASASSVTPITVSALPTTAAVDQTDNQIFVVNAGGSPALNVINGASNSVATTVPLPGTVPVAVAFNPVTDTAYVAGSTGTLTAVDSTNTATTITIGGLPVALAVSPVNNVIYVAKQDGSVTRVSGATGVMGNVTISSPAAPNSILVNQTTNLVYVSRQNGTVLVISGQGGNVLATLAAGSNPGPMVVANSTGNVYVGDLGGTTLTIINGTSVASTVTLSAFAVAMALDQGTGKVWVATSDGKATAITPTGTIADSVTGLGAPVSIASNPLSDRIGVTNATGLSVIDGTTDKLVSSFPIAGGGATVVGNPQTNSLYVINAAGTTVTPINVDGIQPPVVNTVIVGNPDGTVADQTGRVFPTASATPSFTATVTSAYTTSPGYIGVSSATNIVQTELYYQIDAGPLTPAMLTSAGGINPSTFNIALSGQIVGLHHLYIYTAYGNEGGHSSNGNALGNSPEIGNLTGYTFIVIPFPTTLTVTGNPDPVPHGQDITFTATVDFTPQGGTTPNGETVTFYDGDTPIGTGVLSCSGTSCTATLTTDTLDVGAHTINVVYPGDDTYPGSTGSTAQSIQGGIPAFIDVVNPASQSQTQVYGSAFALPLGVKVTDSTHTTGVQGSIITYTITSGPSTDGITFAPLPAGTAADGTASVIATGRAVGTYVVTATVFGSPSIPGVTFTLTVTPATLTVTPGAASRPYGQPNPVFPPPVITGFVNGDSSTVVHGTAALVTTAIQTSSPGSYPITVNQSASTLVAANYTFDYGTGALSITKATPGVDGTAPVTLTSSNDPSTYGEAVTFTSTVPADATGTITFTDTTTGQTLGTVTISGGVATVTTSTLAEGTHNIEATYTPAPSDPNYNGAASQPLAQIVNPAVLTVTANSQTRVYGQPNPTLTSATTGFVNGQGASIVVGMPQLATTAVVNSPPGAYPVTVGVAGVSAPNYTITAVNGTLTVVKATPGQNGTQAVTLTSSLNPSTYGDVVTFTATVPADATGTVTFLDGTVAIGTGTVTGGVATLTTNLLAAGTHAITAQYNGDSNYNVASASLAQVVNPAPSVIAVIVPPGPAPIPAGEPVPISGTVPPGDTGTITFYDGTTPIGTGTISNGIVTIDVDTLAPGEHTITAVYSGDANHLPATSPPRVITIGAPIADFAIANQTPPQIIPPGSSISYSIVLSPVNPPFNGPITLSATNLPPGATFTFTPSTVTTGSSNATTSFTVTVPAQSSVVASRRSGGAPLILATLLLPFALFRRWRGRSNKLLLWMVVTLAALSSATGCGVGGYFSQPQATYVITVMGTSGSLVHSTTATLTVQ